jgi:hypothetical protein
MGETNLMRRVFFVAISSLAVATACGGGSSGGGCRTDNDCPAGQGCKTETVDSYCAPLCTDPSTCPTQSQCNGSTDLPQKECKEVGSPTGGMGVCDLYNGAYGPNTCR